MLISVHLSSMQALCSRPLRLQELFLGYLYFQFFIEELLFGTTWSSGSRSHERCRAAGHLLKDLSLPLHACCPVFTCVHVCSLVPERVYKHVFMCAGGEQHG